MNDYPPGWPEFARQVKEAAGWACVRCGHPHEPATGHCLTVHHFTNNKMEPFENWWAFMALCQRCHLSVQARVDPEIPYMFEHSNWIKPYVAGFYARKYLGEILTREQVAARLDELLDLERVA